MNKLRPIIVLLMCIYLVTAGIITAPCSAQNSDYEDYSADDLEHEWDDYDETIEVYDPYESYNRWMFNFNEKAFTYVMEPVSKGYDFIVPYKARISVNKFFTNVKAPIRFFNNIFQGKFKGATSEFGRFAINSTVGIGGLFDPAKSYFEIEPSDEDFGQTLAHYGISEGPFIVWPLIGPSNRRDSFGFVGDAALNPFTWLSIYEVDPEEGIFGARVVYRVNSFSYRIRDNYRAMYKSAIDPYISIQHAYIQNRKKKIED